MKEYNLDFKEALDIVVNGGSVRGENFTHGVYLRLNRYGQLVIVDANKLYDEDEKVFITTLYNQKFRQVTVMTVKELSY